MTADFGGKKSKQPRPQKYKANSLCWPAARVISIASGTKQLLATIS